MSMIVGPAVFSVVVIAVLVLAEVLKKYTNVPYEVSRKFAHTFAGVSMLFMPAFVTSHWQVLVLALSFSALMYGTKRLGLLGSVHNVGRGLSGVMWYPITGWFLYYIAFESGPDDQALYVIPLLVLAAADAFGAIVGTRYGRHDYEVTSSQRRTMEGSMAFAFVAFLCTQIPLMLLTDMSDGQVLLIALIVSVIAAGVEAISVGGLDNVLVPLGVVVLLESLRPMSVEELAWHGALLVGIGVGIAILFNTTRTPAAGFVFGVIVAWTAYVSGGLQWSGPLIGFLLTFLIYDRLLPAGGDYARFRHSLATAAAALGVPMMLILLGTFTTDPAANTTLFAAYVAAFACNGAILGYILAERPGGELRPVLRRIRTRHEFQYAPTWGKLALAATTAAMPLVLQPTLIFAPDEAATGTLLFAGYALGLAGFGVFVATAWTIAARSTCAQCGRTQLLGQFCCEPDEASPRTSVGSLVTFRKAYMLATGAAAAAVLAAPVTWQL